MCYAGLHDVTMSIWAGNIERARSVNNKMRQVANDHDMALWKLFVASMMLLSTAWLMKRALRHVLMPL